MNERNAQCFGARGQIFFFFLLPFFLIKNLECSICVHRWETSSDWHVTSHWILESSIEIFNGNSPQSKFHISQVFNNSTTAISFTGTIPYFDVNIYWEWPNVLSSFWWSNKSHEWTIDEATIRKSIDECNHSLVRAYFDAYGRFRLRL